MVHEPAEVLGSTRSCPEQASKHLPEAHDGLHPKEARRRGEAEASRQAKGRGVAGASRLVAGTATDVQGRDQELLQKRLGRPDQSDKDGKANRSLGES